MVERRGDDYRASDRARVELSVVTPIIPVAARCVSWRQLSQKRSGVSFIHQDIVLRRGESYGLYRRLGMVNACRWWRRARARYRQASGRTIATAAYWPYHDAYLTDAVWGVYGHTAHYYADIHPAACGSTPQRRRPGSSVAISSAVRLDPIPFE